MSLYDELSSWIASSRLGGKDEDLYSLNESLKVYVKIAAEDERLAALTPKEVKTHAPSLPSPPKATSTRHRPAKKQTISLLNREIHRFNAPPPLLLLPTDDSLPLPSSPSHPAAPTWSALVSAKR